MEIVDLVAEHPQLFHMAEAGSWPSIQSHGLLSTSALLDALGISGEERRLIETEHRSESRTFSHPTFGRIVIRDQKPMPPGRLGPCLRGVTLQEWYKLINGMTFFWPTTTPLSWMNNAPPYRSRSHHILVVDTAKLVAQGREGVRLSDQNSGSANSGRARGRDLFKPIAEFDAAYVREFAVIYSVPGIRDCVMRVEEWRAGKRLGVVWEH